MERVVEEHLLSDDDDVIVGWEAGVEWVVEEHLLSDDDDVIEGWGGGGGEHLLSDDDVIEGWGFGEGGRGALMTKMLLRTAD